MTEAARYVCWSLGEVRAWQWKSIAELLGSNHRSTQCRDAYPFALVGGQAVCALGGDERLRTPFARQRTWIFSSHTGRPLRGAKGCGLSVAMEYFEVLGVGMLLERDNPNPRRAVHLALGRARKSARSIPMPSPSLDEMRHVCEPDIPVVSLSGLGVA